MLFFFYIVKKKMGEYHPKEKNNEILLKDKN